MKVLLRGVSALCVVGLCIITVTTAVDCGSFRNTFKYHYDADKIPCSDFENKLVLEFPATYPSLKPLQSQILANAKKRGYISLAEGRMMNDAVAQVQDEDSNKEKRKIEALKKANGLN